MRVFIAIFPPPEVQETLLHFARHIRIDGNVRWVPSANLHLTLKFLGDIEKESLQNLHTILAEVAGRHAPFYVQPSGFGAFPAPNKARVLWAGVRTGSFELSDLAADVERSLEPVGFGREKKGYRPHATLGRVRGRPARLPEVAHVQAPEFVVRRLDLVQSVLGTGGETYVTLESYRLRG